MSIYGFCVLKDSHTELIMENGYLDGNDVSIIVCKDCTREEINVRRLDVEEGRC